jgi:hypothetical protein
MSYGMYYSVWCAEEANFNPSQQDLTGINPKIAEFDKNSPQEFLQTCSNWAVKPLTSEANQPVISDVPTLLLSGGFDPVTPPSNADAVAAGLSHSYSLTFPLGAHGQMLDNNCSDGIILAFLENPDQTPDSSCIANYSQPEFFTSKTLVDLPVLLKLLNLEDNTGLEALLLALSLLFLLTAIFFLPLAWLVKTLQPKSHKVATPSWDASRSIGTYTLPYGQSSQNSIIGSSRPESAGPPLLVHLSSWVAVINGTFLLTFLIAITVIIFQMITANDNRLFFGVAGEYRFWFGLPLFSMLLTIAMVVASLQGWRWKGWSILRRLYYSTLTLSAIVCLVILGLWKMLAAFFI